MFVNFRKGEGWESQPPRDFPEVATMVRQDADGPPERAVCLFVFRLSKLQLQAGITDF